MANKVAILGGGASALMCAAKTNSQAEITIFEKNGKLGKKLLSTGNGRCNLANKNMNNCSYNIDLSQYFSRYDTKDILSYFEKIGLEYYADNEGRIYPISNCSNSVLDVLVKKIATKSNIKIVLGKTFLDIKKHNNCYEIFFDDNTSECFDKVVVALGNEVSLNVFKSLGIETINFKPSLCSLITSDNKNLSGVRVSGVNVGCRLGSDNFTENGEILFKQNSISGIVIFNLSCFLARKNVKNTIFFIDFMPNINKNGLILKLKHRRDEFNDYKLKDFLTGMFVGSIADMFLSGLHLNYDQYVKCISDKKLEELAERIKNHKVEICGYENNNQIMAGGINIEELDKNLQSKANKGLYFIGEAVNVDGMCGGYNLMWAWLSGMIVSEEI